MYNIGKVLYVSAVHFETLLFDFIKFKTFDLELQTMQMFILIHDIYKYYKLLKKIK